jgi:hypothetical protein
MVNCCILYQIEIITKLAWVLYALTFTKSLDLPLCFMFFPFITKKLRGLASLDKNALGSDMGDCARPYPSHFLGYGLSLAEAHVV